MSAGPRVIATDRAPAAIGAYSQGIAAAGFVYTSGQLGMARRGETWVLEGDVAEQTERALANVAAVLEAGGSSLGSAVKVTVFLADMDDFAIMNGVYQRVFCAAHGVPEGGAAPFPARAAVEAARLPRDGLVEIEAVGLIR
jgi:2-iminobutanoate/2-iminopropanoate deaminase